MGKKKTLKVVGGLADPELGAKSWMMEFEAGEFGVLAEAGEEV